MQSIAPSAKSKSKPVPFSSGKSADCAKAVLETVPAVMWFVRRQLRSRRAKGLSVPQFRVMLLAEKCDKLGLSEISNHLGVSVPTASRIVSGLVDKRFLDRAETDGDRRCRPIRLTPAGTTALRDAWNGTHEAMAEALGKMSVAECRQMSETMLLLGRQIAAAEH